MEKCLNDNSRWVRNTAYEILGPFISTLNSENITPDFLKYFTSIPHSLVLTEDGNIWSFGCGEHGRLGHGDTAEFRTPKSIESLNNLEIHIVHIACGAYHSCKYVRRFVFYRYI